MRVLYFKYGRQLPVLTMLLAAGLLLGLALTAEARTLSTSTVKPSAIEPGTYSLITHGCVATEDASNVAVLRKEDTPYTIEVPGSNVIAGLTASDALSRAQDFVTCNPEVVKTSVTEIKGPDGSVIGYELTPVYMPLRYGSIDPVDVHYKVKGSRVLARVTPDPLLQLKAMG